MRYVFNNPLTWGEELIVALLTWMVFLGAAAAVRSQMHIRIDVMAPVFRMPKCIWLNTLTVIIGIVILVMMIWACMNRCSRNWSSIADDERLQGVVRLGDAGRTHADADPCAQDMDGSGCGAVFRGETEVLIMKEGDGAMILSSLSFILLLAIGLPIALAMMGSSLRSSVWEGTPLSVVAQRVVTGVQSFPLLAIPLFMLAGSLMNDSGISERLFGFTRAFVGHIRGGMAQTAIVGECLPLGYFGFVSRRLCGHVEGVRAATHQGRLWRLWRRALAASPRWDRSFRHRS